MKRISVIGCCGAGKSTLSLKLQQITGLPIIHLDKEYWCSGWRPSENKDFRKRLDSVIAKNKWIIDGHYFSTMDSSLLRSDTVFYLDFSTTICFMRTIRRIFLAYGKDRSDCAEGCPERFDIDFLKYVLNFRKIFRSRTMKLIRKHQHLKVYHFKHPKELDLYFKTAGI